MAIRTFCKERAGMTAGTCPVRFVQIRSVTAVILLLIAPGSVWGQTVSSAKTQSPPHLLVLLADDLGWGDLGLHGGAARTPNIDRIAVEGVELLRYYTYPVCSPTRAAILTGQMPRRYGIASPLQPRDAGLPAGLPTLPRTLQSAGYQTMLVGKWHLGSTSHPNRTGFDHFFGFLGAEIDYHRHTARNGQVDWQRNGNSIREAGYSTFLLADEAVRLIQHRDFQRPFYLQVAFNAPHFPLAAPPEYEAKYRNHRGENITRLAMLDALDDAIGRILETLDEEGLRRNTLVVFLSDNGADQSGRNGPFRGAKGSTFEGGIHVPCLLRWPAELDPGTSSQQPMTAQDLFPTLTAAVGLPWDESVKIDGKNLWDPIRGGTVQDRGPFLISAANSALFDGDWKFIETAAGKNFLFNLRNDPGETSDRLQDEPVIAERLQAAMQQRTREFPPMQKRGPPARPQR